MTENQANTPPVVRYVHQGEAGGPRFTAAYVRTDDAVFFSWASVYHTDRFVKSIGREVSLERLEEFVSSDLTKVIGYTLINPSKCVGLLDIDDIKDELSSTIADHLLADMTFHDLKHAYISDIIRSNVESAINGEFECPQKN